LKAEEAVPALLTFMRASRPDVRVAVVSALAEIGTRDALDALRVSVEDPDSGVRFTALRGLRSRLDEADIPLLVRRLSDPNERIRADAASMLSVLREGVHDHAITALRDAAVKSDVITRLASVGTLRRVPDPAARDALRAIKNASPGFVSRVRALIRRKSRAPGDT
jgi:HEAT repeat protein